MSKTESAARRFYDELLYLLAQNRGQTHSSIREACVDYGRMAHLHDTRILTDLRCVALVSDEDAKGAMIHA